MNGVMLTAYGTPRTLDDVEAYYTDIRGGRKPDQAALADLVGRYRAIGGTSPLVKITNSQVDRLQSLLREHGSSTRVYAGMRHSPPFISEVLGAAAKDGVDRMLCIALAPHYSYMSIGAYIKAADSAVASQGTGMKLSFVRSWHTNPILISTWAENIKKAEERLMAGKRYDLVFTAHSLPERIVKEGDPYRSQLMETAAMIAKVVDKEWSFAFQSMSRTGEPWMGPDIIDHLAARRQAGADRFLIAPIGFTSDHLEILYDLDIECVEWARSHGVTVGRCESLNDSEGMIRCLYSLVEQNGFLA